MTKLSELLGSDDQLIATLASQTKDAMDSLASKEISPREYSELITNQLDEQKIAYLASDITRQNNILNAMLLLKTLAVAALSTLP